MGMATTALGTATMTDQRTEVTPYRVEIVAPTVALVFYIESDILIGCVFIDHSDAWNVRYGEKQGYLPINDVLRLLNYQKASHMPGAR